MKLLLDTHLLLWAATAPQRLSVEAQGLFNDPDNELYFSAVSICEVAIKRVLDRSDLQVDVRQFRRGLVDNGYLELAMSSLHAVAIDTLPAVHRDPFDRMWWRRLAWRNRINLVY